MHLLNTFHEFDWHHLGTTWTTLVDYSDNMETTWHHLGTHGTHLGTQGQLWDNFEKTWGQLWDIFEIPL